MGGRSNQEAHVQGRSEANCLPGGVPACPYPWKIVQQPNLSCFCLRETSTATGRFSWMDADIRPISTPPGTGTHRQVAGGHPGRRYHRLQRQILVRFRGHPHTQSSTPPSATGSRLFPPGFRSGDRRSGAYTRPFYNVRALALMEHGEIMEYIVTKIIRTSATSSAKITRK